MQRIHEIRQLVIPGAVYVGKWGNRKSVTIDDVVDGGPIGEGDPLGVKGVIVGHQTRLGRVSLSQPPTSTKSLGKQVAWRDEPDKVQSIVLMRKGEFTRPALEAVKERVKELNDPESGRLLPGVQIEKYYDRSELIGITTDTVEENLLVGMILVVLVLLMFLNNVRTAFIVAINIPLALLFAFSVLYFRGKSANLLSIGAVDFGIIVDSSVIIVENIYRHLSTGEDAHLPLKERILKSTAEVTKALIFSTLIMVCAFLPLFTMTGPEGQLFGPMAETYAFALGGALVLALTLSPVLCLLFLHAQKPTQDNILVRSIKWTYLSALEFCLRHRIIGLSVMVGLLVATAVIVLQTGREFMPELEEGNLWITATFPANVSMNEAGDKIEVARKVMAGDPADARTFPGFKEVEVLVPSIGRPDDGTDPTGYYRTEIFAPLRPEKDWPLVHEETGWRRWTSGWSLTWGHRWPRLTHTNLRPRTKEQLIKELNTELRSKVPGVDWNFSQYIRDNVTEAMSGVKGDNSVKIFGPDLNKLEELGDRIKNVMSAIDGIEDVGVFKIMGQTNLEFRIDLEKCKIYGVQAADVNNLIATAVGGKAMSTMIEGEKSFDITLRLPPAFRVSESAILDIPLDISNGQVMVAPATIATEGSSAAPPSQSGSQTDTSNNPASMPRISLRQLVSPVGKDGRPDPRGSFERPAASVIYRENGKRQIAVKFSVRGRDLAGAVAEAREKTRPIIQSPYRAEWAGEFQEMEQAERKLMIIIPVSMALIFLLLYVAFRSLLDAVVALSNVLALSMGGIWALWLTGTNFSISAAVGFISLFGVAIMDGLILISSFNGNRAHGMHLREAIVNAAAKRVRPLTMTALTAILGLLPAALSTRIGAQTQRPLAIVVVGGMLTTLFLTRFLMPMLYSLYGHREPPAGSGDLAH
jgi:heavy metal efflux system protein